ncbi:hypothetical protein B566_EDAN013176 [Ephemera danica]|nr:hypothetical protein B566_EDAN013176 [Ephemera danica]
MKNLCTDQQRGNMMEVQLASFIRAKKLLRLLLLLFDASSSSNQRLVFRVAVVFLGIILTLTQASGTKCRCVNATYCIGPHYESVQPGEQTCATEDEVCCQRVEVTEQSCGYYDTDSDTVPWMTTPVTLNDDVRALCLPNQGERFEGKVCKFAGWDSTKAEDERDVKKNQQYVLKKEQCQDDLRSFETHFPHWLHLHSSLMCTIGDLPFERPSKGDGGAPLFCEIAGSTERYVLAGMAAWKTPDSGPAVFTNVARFRDWIDDYLGRLNRGVELHKL